MKDKTFLLTVPEETWKNFKKNVTKDTTINDKLISLIELFSKVEEDK